MPSFPYQDALRIQPTPSAVTTYVKGRMIAVGTGGLLGVVAETKKIAAAATDGLDVWIPGSLYMAGVVRNTGDGAWALGVKVYWDATNNRFTTTAASHTLAGYAAKAAASADAAADIIYLPTVQT